MAQGSMDSDRLSSAGISTHSSGTAGTMGGSVVGVRVGENNKKEDEEDYNLGPLPLNWEKAFTPNGEVYFIDHNMGTSHWLDPRLARVRKHSLGECGEDELPYGWERVTDKTYGSYYVDHINRKTQYENPVLQARRLRAEKSSENGDGDQQNGSAAGELRGTRFTVTLVKGTLGLGFTMVAAEGIPEIEGYLQIRNIVPHSPAWNNGSLRAGDVVVGIGSVGVRGLAHHQVVQLFQTIAPGDDVTLHLVRGYPPSFDSEDPNTRVLRTLAVDAKPEPPGDSAMHQLTRALRTRFNLESPSGPADEADGPGPQRRLLSRSFDLDAAERPETDHRCPSADHLLTLATEHSSRSDMMGEPGRELVVMLQRGNAGFGFTIADSVHGQKVKKVLDVGRCAGLREGDVVVQVGATRVRGASHARVVAALQACPPHEPTAIRVWRRAPPRARSASRVHNASPNNNLMGSRSKTPTADQLRNTSLHTQDSLRDRLNGIDNGISPVEATYAVPEPLSERRLLERRRSTPPAGAPGPGWQEPWIDMANVRDWENNQKWEDNRQKWDQKWDDNVRKWDGTNNGWEANGGSWNGNPPMPAGGAEWGEAGTPTVHVDMAYWRHRDHSIADSEDNGGFPEDGMLHSPTTAAISGLARQSPSASRHRGHSPTNSGRLRSHSPSTASATDRLLANSPSARLQSQSPSNNSSNGPLKGSPLRLRETSPPRHLHSPPRRSPPCYDAEPQQQGVYVATYPQVSAGGAGADPCADVLVRLARGGAGFGFRIVGGTEDGSRVAVGYVVPGGPADGLLRPGDLLTSVDGIPLAGATHARAVSYVCQAATRGHVTLGVRHNRADIQPLGLPQHPHSQQHLTSDQMAVSPASYNIVHPAPVYPPQAHLPMYGAQYGGAGWAPGPYDVTVSRGEGEGFGFVVISSTNKATSTIGQLIPNSPAARCGLLHVGDTIIAINHTPIRNLPHPEVVALIKHSGSAVTLTVASDGRVD